MPRYYIYLRISQTLVWYIYLIWTMCVWSMTCMQLFYTWLLIHQMLRSFTSLLTAPMALPAALLLLVNSYTYNFDQSNFFLEKISSWSCWFFVYQLKAIPVQVLIVKAWALRVAVAMERNGWIWSLLLVGLCYGFSLQTCSFRGKMGLSFSVYCIFCINAQLCQHQNDLVLMA